MKKRIQQGQFNKEEYNFMFYVSIVTYIVKLQVIQFNHKIN